MTVTRDKLPWRQAVGIVLLNGLGQVFVGHKPKHPADIMEMPHGGIDDGEEPLAAAYRELEEETGLTASDLRLEGYLPVPMETDLPDAMLGVKWRGKYRGAQTHWFLFRLVHEDRINIDTAHPEFDAWKWVEPEAVPALAQPWRRWACEPVLTLARYKKTMPVSWRDRILKCYLPMLLVTPVIGMMSTPAYIAIVGFVTDSVSLDSVAGIFVVALAFAPMAFVIGLLPTLLLSVIVGLIVESHQAWWCRAGLLPWALLVTGLTATLFSPLILSGRQDDGITWGAIVLCGLLTAPVLRHLRQRL